MISNVMIMDVDVLRPVRFTQSAGPFFTTSIIFIYNNVAFIVCFEAALDNVALILLSFATFEWVSPTSQGDCKKPRATTRALNLSGFLL